MENNIKKINFCFGLLEILVFIGYMVVVHYTNSKMGMARHMVYLNSKLNKALPINPYIFFAVIIIVLILINIYLGTKDKEEKAKIRIDRMLFRILSISIFFGSQANKYFNERLLYTFLFMICLIAILEVLRKFVVVYIVYLAKKREELYG